MNKPESTTAFSPMTSQAPASHAERSPWFRRHAAPAGRRPRTGVAARNPGGSVSWPRRRRSLPAAALVLSCAAVLAGPFTATPAAAQEPPVPAVAVAPEPAVNINTATAQELAEALTGIGASKAEAIVRYRTQFGPFGSIEELTEVRGIGAATVERNRSLLRLQD